MKRKHNAFTLAEVLITLGIIGVVAAMTLPIVVSKYQERVTVTKVKKIYSNLSNAYLLAKSKNGAPSSWATTNSTSGNSYAASRDLALPIIQNMKLVKDCQSDSGCFPDGSVKLLNNSYWNDNINTGTHRYKVMTIDGVSIAIHSYATSCDSVVGNLKDRCGNIYVNIDGSKAKENVNGKNFFQFFITNRGITPIGSHVDYDEVISTCKNNGDNCTTWVLSQENLDYLKK